MMDIFEEEFINPSKKAPDGFTSNVMRKIKKDLSRRININMGVSLVVSGILLFFSLYTGYDFIYHVKNIVYNTAGIIVKLEDSSNNSIEFIDKYLYRGYQK